MQYRIFCFTLFFFYFWKTSAQIVPDSTILMKGDAIDSVVTDTSIIYVIKRAPIQLKERIEIERARRKINRALNLSIDFGAINYSEKIKAKTSSQDYIDQLKNSLNNQLSYSFGIELWRCPKKIYTGIDAHFYKLRQEFIYQNYSFTNRFSYAGIRINTGYCLLKNKTFTIIPYGGISAENCNSTSGFTLDKNTYEPTRANGLIHYKPYMLNLATGIKIIVRIKNTGIELQPQLLIPAMAASTSQNDYSIHRYIFDVKIGFVNRFF